jgi:YggT family protein
MILPLRVIYVVLTLYMMLIIVRWLGGWLGLEVEFGRMRWVAKTTDPLINWLRKRLPHMGPVDFGPLAALLLVWLVRVLVTRH